MSVKVYVTVFAVLVGVTAAELSLFGIQGISRTLTITTLIGLAGFKALLVAAFFQHLKDEPRPLSVVLLAGLVIAMALMSISFLQLHSPHS
jgi:cytochrome c oxidase subunit 4